jgi:hypothetical protein
MAHPQRRDVIDLRHQRVVIGGVGKDDGSSGADGVPEFHAVLVRGAHQLPQFFVPSRGIVFSPTRPMKGIILGCVEVRL